MVFNHSTKQDRYGNIIYNNLGRIPMPLKDKDLIDRPNYGSRRVHGVSPAIVPDEDTSLVPNEADIFFDVARGRGRIYRSAGKSTQVGRDPPALLGKSASRATEHGYIASTRNGGSETMALYSIIARGATDVGHANRTFFELHDDGVGSGADDISLMENVIAGVMPNKMFALDVVGLANYNYALLGWRDRQDHASHVKRVNLSLGQGADYYAQTLQSAQIIPQTALGVNSNGRPTQVLLFPEAAGSQTVLDISTPDHGQALDDLGMRMIMTPDEYCLRNKEAIKHLISRLATFQANDFVGAFQKGFRSSFWTRQSDADLVVIGELLHVGMSLRLGYPVRNVHTEAYVNQYTFNYDDKTGATQTGLGGMYHAASGHSSEMNIEDGDAQTDGVPDTEGTESIFGATAEAQVLYAVNGSVSPFWVFLEDASMMGATGDQSGYYMSALEVGTMLTPGLYEKDTYANVNRDLSFEDVLYGLKWVLDNTSEDSGMHWCTVGKHMLENWKDFKAGEIIDLYAESSRTDGTALRAAWNLGVTSTGHFLDGGEPATVTVGDVGDYYNEGFLDLAAIDNFKRDVNDLSLRNFRVGPRFMKGMQSIGDSNTTVFHRTTADGKEHYTDVKVMPHALGAWANVPTWARITGTGANTTPITFVMDGLGSGEGSGVGYSSMIIAVDTNDPILWHATGDCMVRASGSPDCYGSSLLGGNLTFVFRHDPANIGNALNWSALSGTFTHVDPSSVIGATSTNLARAQCLGHDLSGMVSIYPTLQIYSDSTRLWDPLLLSVQVTSAFPRWLDEFSRIVKVIEDSKNIVPYKSDYPGIAFEGINLVSLLTFNTGDPAMQQLADALFSLASCGSSGGWAISHRAMTPRRIFDDTIHQYQSQRSAAQIDYLGFVLPRDFDASKLLTVLAISNIVADKVGTLGLRWTRDSGRHHELGYGAVRSIYRYEVLPNGVTIENRITAYDEGYDFATDLVDVFASLSTPSQASCQPGINWHNRLFQTAGAPIISATGTSFCNLMGTTSVPALTDSTVEGLSGYAGDIDASVLAALGIPNYTDGDPSSQTPRTRIDPDLIRQMVEVNRGTNNLYYRESGLQIAMIDQDVVDSHSAILSAMVSAESGKMLLGPCPHAVVYNSGGDIIYEVSDVYSWTGSGEAASQAPAASGATEEGEMITETEGPTETQE
jgi:hypothetical protein